MNWIHKITDLHSTVEGYPVLRCGSQCRIKVGAAALGSLVK